MMNHGFYRILGVRPLDGRMGGSGRSFLLHTMANFNTESSKRQNI